MMKCFHSYLYSILAVFLSVMSAANGQVLFTDDFEAWTVGEPVTDSGPENDPQRWKSDGDPFDIIEQDTGNVFGLGTENQFMRVGNVPVDGGLPGGSLDIEQRSYDKGDGVPTGVLQVSFDFYEPSSGSGKGFVSDLSDPGYLRIRGDKTGAGLHIIILDDGELQVAGEGEEVLTLHTYGEDTLVRFDFVFNQSGEDVTYRDNVLNSGKVDIYANNILVAANIETGTNDALDEIERILLRTEYAEGGTIAQEMWVDNWQTAAVPPDPSGGGVETWAGFIIEVINGVDHVNTSDDFIGWLQLGDGGWVYSYSLGKWLFMPEGTISESGGWAFSPK